MEFKGIEHYDIFDGDVIIFWVDVSGPPQELQAIAKEIDGRDYNPNGFGVCVNYSFEEKEFYLVTDTGCAGTPEDERLNIFYTDFDGGKHWLKTDIPQELMDRIFEECGKIAECSEKEQTEPLLNQTELEKRLAAYMESSDFSGDINYLANDYRAQGLPVPPMDLLRKEAAAEARKCLETIMICEAKGHLWEEKADPENGTSTLSCRRCGVVEHLQW